MDPSGHTIIGELMWHAAKSSTGDTVIEDSSDWQVLQVPLHLKYNF